TPETSIGFFDSFDDWAVGEVTNGKDWEYRKEVYSSVTSVQVVPDDVMGGNVLQLIDDYHSTVDEYATSPTATRTMAPINAKMTFKTRTKISRVNHDIGNYLIEIIGGSRVLGTFVGFSDGGLGFQRMVDNKYEYVRLPESNYRQPF